MWVLIIALSILAAPLTAQAYVGPGAGLGMLGSLLAVIGAVLLSLVGLVLWPLRMMKKRKRAKARGDGARSSP